MDKIHGSGSKRPSGRSLDPVLIDLEEDEIEPSKVHPPTTPTGSNIGYNPTSHDKDEMKHSDRGKRLRTDSNDSLRGLIRSSARQTGKTQKETPEGRARSDKSNTLGREFGEKRTATNEDPVERDDPKLRNMKKLYKLTPVSPVADSIISGTRTPSRSYSGASTEPGPSQLPDNLSAHDDSMGASIIARPIQCKYPEEKFFNTPNPSIPLGGRIGIDQIGVDILDSIRRYARIEQSLKHEIWTIEDGHGNPGIPSSWKRYCREPLPVSFDITKPFDPTGKTGFPVCVFLGDLEVAFLLLSGLIPAKLADCWPGDFNKEVSMGTGLGRKNVGRRALDTEGNQLVYHFSRPDEPDKTYTLNGNNDDRLDGTLQEVIFRRTKTKGKNALAKVTLALPPPYLAANPDLGESSIPSKQKRKGVAQIDTDLKDISSKASSSKGKEPESKNLDLGMEGIDSNPTCEYGPVSTELACVKVAARLLEESYVASDASKKLLRMIDSSLSQLQTMQQTPGMEIDSVFKQIATTFDQQQIRSIQQELNRIQNCRNHAVRFCAQNDASQVLKNMPSKGVPSTFTNLDDDGATDLSAADRIEQLEDMF